MSKNKLNPSNFKGTPKSRDKKGIEGPHWSRMYDLDEDLAGQVIDESTGKSIDNSVSAELEAKMIGLHELQDERNLGDTLLDALQNDPELVQLFERWEQETHDELKHADMLMVAELEESFPMHNDHSRTLAKQALRALK